MLTTNKLINTQRAKNSESKVLNIFLKLKISEMPSITATTEICPSPGAGRRVAFETQPTINQVLNSKASVIILSALQDVCLEVEGVGGFFSL